MIFYYQGIHTHTLPLRLYSPTHLLPSGRDKKIVTNRLLGKKFEQDLLKADFGQFANKFGHLGYSKPSSFPPKFLPYLFQTSLVLLLNRE